MIFLEQGKRIERKLRIKNFGIKKGYKEKEENRNR